jgi:hypothetical protein
MSAVPFISHHLYVAAVAPEEARPRVAEDSAWETQDSPDSGEAGVWNPAQRRNQAETTKALKGLKKLSKLSG